MTKNLKILALFFILITTSCSTLFVKPSSTADLTIFYTNDEHGWIEDSEKSGGAAGIVGIWKEKNGYSKDGPFLVLSGGDMWTGPAISTWTKGRSTIAVMNAMGYDAAAIGNHEFDWNIEGLENGIKLAEFPLLSSNIKKKETGDLVDFVKPFIIKTINGINIGIIGLSAMDTPYSTFPDYVKDYNFIPYDDALKEYVPQVKNQGAELLVVVGHISKTEMMNLAPLASEMGISIIGGGHSHEYVNEIINGVAIIEAGGQMSHFGKIEILFDTIADTVIELKQNIIKNEGSIPDKNIESIVCNWRSKIDSTLSQVIGFTNQDINQWSNAMHNMVTDSWLKTFSSADISMTNSGGIRQNIPQGNIILEDIIGVLPFENNIVELELTGTQVIDCMKNYLVAGISSKSNHKLADGTTIHPDSTYQVLTIDYLYIREDTPFRKYDPDPDNLLINYRQPVIDWIKSLNTTARNPLDLYLDKRDRD
jgi:2',3'-cyclic-nucleotide 2'-phosphodiesterase (5'-nucleotidase family)